MVTGDGTAGARAHSPSSSDGIEELYIRFGALFDSGASEEWARLFVPDGSFTLRSGRVLTGRDELAAFAAEFASAARARSARPHHLITEITVARSDHDAEGSCLSELVETDDQGSRALVARATYRDRLRRVDGSWLFVSRSSTALPLIR